MIVTNLARPACQCRRGQKLERRPSMRSADFKLEDKEISNVAVTACDMHSHEAVSDIDHEWLLRGTRTLDHFAQVAHHDVVDLPPRGTATANAELTPTSEKAPDAANVEGPVRTETQWATVAQPATDGKRFATLRAHLALRGYSLHHNNEGIYIVTRWNLSRLLADLDGVDHFMRTVAP